MMNVRLQYCIRDMASINMPHLLRICVVGCRVKKSQCNESAIVETKIKSHRLFSTMYLQVLSMYATGYTVTNKNETAPFRATHMIWQASSF